MSSRYQDSSTTVYVGDLPRESSERELERIFREFGRLRNVWVARNPPGFAFVEFENAVDANDAVRELDGTGKSRQKPWIRGGARNGGLRDRMFPNRQRKVYDPSDRCYQCGERGHYAYDCYKAQTDGGSDNRNRFNGRRRSSLVSVSRRRLRRDYREPTY